MAVPFLKVNYTPPDGATQEITELMFTNNKRGLDLKNGTFTFRVNNSPFRDKVSGESIFKEDGVVEAYADYSPITESTDQLLFSGQVRELKPTFGSQGSQYEVACSDRTSVLLGTLWSQDFANKSAPQIIIDIVMQNTEHTDQPVTTNNVATSGTTSSFPTFNYAQTFKPIIEWISELSQPEYTGEDRAYMFFVDKNNDLHWFYPSQTSSGSITEGTDEIYSWRLTRNADSVVNMVIYNAGTDCNGNGTLGYYWDSTSKSNTLKMKYYPMTDISKVTFDSEIAAGNIVESSSGTIPYKGKLHILNTSSGTTSWGVAYSTEDDYKDKFRARLKSVADARADKVTKRLGKLLWNGSIELKGTNSYTAGDLITFTSPTLGIRNYLLRVVDVNQTFDKNGWFTTLELKEDEEAIAASQVV